MRDDGAISSYYVASRERSLHTYVTRAPSFLQGLHSSVVAQRNPHYKESGNHESAETLVDPSLRLSSALSLRSSNPAPNTDSRARKVAMSSSASC